MAQLAERTIAGGPRRPAAPQHSPSWRRELLLLIGVYALYSLIRNAAPSQVAEAQANAVDILAAERALGMDVELDLNLAVADIPWLIIPLNYFYATLHMAATATVMVWLYRRRPAHYARCRLVLATMTLIALACYYLYPLAPPRLMAGAAYVDTVARYGLWGVEPSEDMISLSNQYAAMPSMHFGWALWVGVMLVWLSRRTWLRALGALYPLLTLYVIVVTANHFILDAVAGAALFALTPGLLWLGARVLSPVRAGLAVRRTATLPRSPTSRPQYAEPDLVDPELAGPELADPELAGPELADPDLAGSELAEPELVDPELADPELVDPELAEPGFAEVPSQRSPVEQDHL